MAVSATFLSADRACAAAPEPRPPQPIRPMRSVSPGESWPRAELVRTKGAASAAAAEVLMNSRRVSWEEGDRFMLLSVKHWAKESQAAGWDWGNARLAPYWSRL